MINYLDFELEISPGRGREYLVAVLRSPAGEARETMHFPFDELELENRLLILQNALLRSGGQRRQALSSQERAVQDFGRKLFDALLTGEVRNRYDVSQERAIQHGQGLRLKLRIRSPELAALPWEFLYDAREAEYLCLSRATPLVRYLELPRPPQPLTVRPPLRILGMVASPSDQAQLNVAREKQRVERATRSLWADGLVELTWLPGQTWRHLQRTMRHGPWHVFHFIGHGGFDRNRDEGYIALADEGGETQRLMATQLARLLANHRSLRLALLNSCEGARGSTHDIFSSTGSILVRRGIPAVLAMQYEITDRAAIELARAFYESLADGLPVDAALVEARTAISLAVNNTVEWGTPVLFMRAPDGVLFDIQGREVAPRQAQVMAVKAEPRRARVEKAAPTPVATRKPFEPEMILIPAGKFLMGSDPQKDKNARDDEQPQHTLHLADYYLARTPLTNAQYLAFVQATGHRIPFMNADWARPFNWDQGSKASPQGKENHPVVLVSWHDAVTYCRWLAEATGKPYRLPSEAEWEKGARGTDGRIYPWGDRWDAMRCNTSEGGKKDTVPVGAYPQGASPYKLLDMAGSVWEWCATRWQKEYPLPQIDEWSEDYLGGASLRVLRGGSWYYLSGHARSAYRFNDFPLTLTDFGGFRCCVSSTSSL